MAHSHFDLHSFKMNLLYSIIFIVVSYTVSGLLLLLFCFFRFCRLLQKNRLGALLKSFIRSFAQFIFTEKSARVLKDTKWLLFPFFLISPNRTNMLVCSLKQACERRLLVRIDYFGGAASI